METKRTLPPHRPVLRLIDCERQRRDDQRAVTLSVLKVLVHEAKEGRVGRCLIAYDNGPDTKVAFSSTIGHDTRQQLRENLALCQQAALRFAQLLEDLDDVD